MRTTGFFPAGGAPPPPPSLIFYQLKSAKSVVKRPVAGEALKLGRHNSFYFFQSLSFLLSINQAVAARLSAYPQILPFNSLRIAPIFSAEFCALNCILCIFNAITSLD